ncbi:MAG: MvaI/BcnI restriction endonuclease family protein [Verrucomicrobia bacterium]|nr:MvaI/BcnI restriction endonuclease family protein [Verrucomicrobiota bacterium]
MNAVTTSIELDFLDWGVKQNSVTSFVRADSGTAIALMSDAGEVAAAWAFTGLLAHWSRKHTRAVYVPSMRRTEPHWQYAYGARVRLAQKTDGLRLLKAMASGAVYYDPGIKLEQASSEKPSSKKRSQFRVASKNIAALYETVEIVEV